MITSMITAAPSAITLARKDDLDIPTLSADATTSYTYSIDVNAMARVKNPYIHKSILPENLVFIIIGAIILLMMLAMLMFWIVSSVLSWNRAKNQSEKYFYNLPVSFDSSSSSSSSLHEKMSRNTIFTNLDNASMLSLNQPLGRSYRNSALDNTRMSMFISPTSELLNYTDSSVNVSSNVSFVQLNESADEKINLLSEEPVVKSKRPPSQYLEDLLDDSVFDKE